MALVLPPVLLIDGGTVSERAIGETFAFTGSGYTPGRTVTRWLRAPDGGETMLTPILSADGAGRLLWNFTPNCASPTGTFTLRAVDDATGRTSNSVTETITPSAICDATLLIDGSTASERPIGETFAFTGSGYTAFRTVTRWLRDPNGLETMLAPTLSADSTGRLPWLFTPSCASSTGTFTLWAVDDATGRTSNTVTETVTASPSCAP